MVVGVRTLIAGIVAVLLLAAVSWADITGSISGVVTDPSGAVVSGAKVVATNTQTGISSSVTTDSKGFFVVAALPVGDYTLQIAVQGFKTYQKTGIRIDANSAVRADATLAVGTVSEKVEVTTEAVHVETQNTQMGEVISAKSIAAMPLNGRAFTDLLALQPGVSPYTATDTGTSGINDRPVDGGLNSGNQSVNGQREASNGFMVNGINVEEGKTNGASVIPNIDSIAEFRIITNNFDAEYGNYSGGMVNVVSKSGTNRFHGNAFEFLRNTALDAKNYFSAPDSPTPVYRQNQFGGTLGGPIKKDSTFFFVDYQGTRQTQAPTQTAQVPSVANLAGNFSDSADSMTGSVGGPYFANLLSQRLGYPVSNGEPYYFGGCADNTQCVFPNAVIPQKAWSPVAINMTRMGLFPQPNLSNPNFNFSSSQYAQTLTDDKGGIHIDQITRFGNFSGYYFIDDYVLDSPYPSGGATVPAASFPYAAATAGRAQLASIGYTKTFGPSAVNEFRFGYVRNALALTTPSGGVGPDFSLSNLGFITPWNAETGGISAIAPNLEGVPYITFNGFSIGVPQVTTRQYNNTFQWLDNFSKVIGKHSLKFGGQFHYDQINERNLAAQNGQYSFSGNETGIDFADFLIGAPNSLTQASPQILDSRSKYYALFAQDSWRVTGNLVLNYGLRWEASMPWYDTQDKIETIIPGKQSVKFPGAPLGYVMAGDPGVPRTLAPTKWDNFAPRIGLAYSPEATSGIFGKLFGGPGRSSIRVGYGLYYTSVEDLSQFLEVGDPPYGLYYGSANPPLLEAPYLNRYDGSSVGQRFPFPFPSTNVSPSNPDTTFPWPQVQPLSYDWSYNNKNVLPYSQHYELSVQRQIGNYTVVTASYVGNTARHLIAAVEANPANQSLCLFLNNPANLAPNSAGPCGPFSETPPFTVTVVNGQSIGTSTPWVTSTGQVITSVRPLGPLFDTNPLTSTIATSNYNSFQASANFQSTWLSLIAGYTYSKCFDNSSGLQEGVYPFAPSRSYALCAFDVHHNFVISYNWILPFDRFVEKRWAKAVVGGWSLSGITNFATGLPISMTENDDNSLIGANASPVDVPNFAGGPVLADTNPRHNNPYFNTSLFSIEQLGTFGNSSRRFFHGPGLCNFSMALAKTTKITESTQLEFRMEGFNIFNHAQFLNPAGEINDPTFGLVTSARDPRIFQFGVKFAF